MEPLAYQLLFVHVLMLMWAAINAVTPWRKHKAKHLAAISLLPLIYALAILTLVK